MRFFLLALLLLLPAAFALRAQPAPEPTRSLRFYYAGFAATGDEDQPAAKFLVREGALTTAFDLRANAFSDTLDYAGPVPVALFREKPAATGSGVEREDLGRLEFPAHWKGVLFIVTRNDADPRLPFRFYPVEYWAPSLPANGARILNLDPRPLAARVGASRRIIDARSSADLDLPAGATDVTLRLAVQNAERWDTVLSTSILRPAQDKLLLLVFPRPDGRPRVLVLNTLPEPPE